LPQFKLATPIIQFIFIRFHGLTLLPMGVMLPLMSSISLSALRWSLLLTFIKGPKNSSGLLLAMTRRMRLILIGMSSLQGS